MGNISETERNLAIFQDTHFSCDEQACVGKSNFTLKH